MPDVLALQHTVQRTFRRPRALLWTFIGVHLLFLVLQLPLIINGQVLSDIQYYRQWALEGINHGVWPGITVKWVYPVAALAPMLIALALGPYLYQLSWFLLLTVINAAAVAALTGRGRRTAGYPGAYWWLGATALLGPVALGRIDGLTAPMVMVALIILARRPVLAAALLSTATWMKVWPAAVIAAAVAASRVRLKMLATGAAVSAVIAAVVALGGDAHYLFGFVNAQSTRGMQMEAPFTTPGLWQAVLGLGGARIYEDTTINTREIRGALGEPVAAAMTPLLIAAAVAVVLLLLWALRSGADRSELVLLGGFGLAGAFIVFNKVGSPQFMLWLVAVAAVGLAHDRHRWRVPGMLLLVVAALTTLVYPVGYELLYEEHNLLIAAALSVRNLLVVVLFGWAVREIIRSARAAKYQQAPVPG